MVESAQEILFSEHMVYFAKLFIKVVRTGQKKCFKSLFNSKFIIGITILTLVIYSLSRSFMA